MCVCVCAGACGVYKRLYVDLYVLVCSASMCIYDCSMYVLRARFSIYAHVKIDVGNILMSKIYPIFEF